MYMLFWRCDLYRLQGKPTLGVTIATWVKAKNLTGPNVNEIFVTAAPGVAGPTKQGEYHFEILDKGRVRFFQRNNGKTVYGRTTKETIPLNTWVHLAGIYNPNSKQALIYINGHPVLDYEQTEPHETDSLSTDWSKGAFIGSFTDDLGTSRQFKGALDEFYMFPCALTGQQIVKLRDTHKMRKFMLDCCVKAQRLVDSISISLSRPVLFLHELFSGRNAGSFPERGLVIER